MANFAPKAVEHKNDFCLVSGGQRILYLENCTLSLAEPVSNTDWSHQVQREMLHWNDCVADSLPQVCPILFLSFLWKHTNFAEERTKEKHQFKEPKLLAPVFLFSKQVWCKRVLRTWFKNFKVFYSKFFGIFLTFLILC